MPGRLHLDHHPRRQLDLSSNQPLMIIDGLPIDNKTMNTGVLASDAPGSATRLQQPRRGLHQPRDRHQPRDIETLTVLKGPEAAALYGIDAANGAIVITTKRGKAGTGGLTYSNSFRIETVRAQPELQRIYRPDDDRRRRRSARSSTSAHRTRRAPRFYDNIDGFFQTGADAEAQPGVQRRRRGQPHQLPRRRGAHQAGRRGARTPATTASTSRAPRARRSRTWLKADLSMQYSYANNDQIVQGRRRPAHRPAALAADGQRPGLPHARRHAPPRHDALARGSEIGQSVLQRRARTRSTRRTTASIANLGARSSRRSRWGNLSTPRRRRATRTQNLVAAPPGEHLRHLEQRHHRPGRRHHAQHQLADAVQRQAPHRSWKSLVGVRHARQRDPGRQVHAPTASTGQDFLDPNFVSINNTQTKSSRHDDRAASPVQRTSAQATFDCEQLPVRDGHRPQRLDVDDPEPNATRSSIPASRELHLHRRLPVARRAS